MKIEKAMQKVRQRQKAAADGPTTREDHRQPDKLPTNNASPAYHQSQYLEPDKLGVISNRCVGLSTDSPELDFYKILRTQILQRTKPKGWNTVMITSTRPGEGKTLTAINLALTIAKAYNQTVLLVDCDLRQQKIYQYLGLHSDKGIVNYMLNGHQLNELIIWPKVEKLTLVSGGRTVSESAELLGSPRMKELVAEMKARYEDRYIIFDTPPLLSGDDALAFSPLVDGIVMVVQEGKTPIKEVQKAFGLIPKEKFLGFVLNQANIPKKYGYYRYDAR
jgi:protein-tyrosine kinase